MPCAPCTRPVASRNSRNTRDRSRPSASATLQARRAGRRLQAPEPDRALQSMRGSDGEHDAAGHQPDRRARAQRLQQPASADAGDDEAERAPQPHAAVVEPRGLHAGHGQRLGERHDGRHGEREQHRAEQQRPEGRRAAPAPAAPAAPAQARPIRKRRWSPNRSAANASAGVTTTRTTSGAAVMMAISRCAQARASRARRDRTAAGCRPPCRRPRTAATRARQSRANRARPAAHAHGLMPPGGGPG